MSCSKRQHSKEYEEHFLFDQNNQPFSIWDLGVKARKDAKEPVWEEFPFDPDKDQNSDLNASYEMAIGGEDVFDKEACMEKPHNDSSIKLGAALTCNQGDSEGEIELGDHRALVDEKFKEVLKFKSDLPLHVANCKQRPEELVEYDPLHDLEHF